MDKNKLYHSTIGLIFAFSFIFMVFLLIKSEGTPTHDEIGHYLISRDALYAPKHILDPWGRTLHTLLYCIPAQFGLKAVRVLSLILAFLTAFLTIKVSEILKIKNLLFVSLFLFFQPWFMGLSYLCITEVPFSLFMILGVYLFLKNKFFSASIVVGLLPLIRHEGIALAVLWILYLAYKKDMRSILAVFLPLIIYNIIFYLFEGNWPFAMYFEPKPNEVYGRGTLYHFLIRLPHPRAVGIPIMLMVAFSIVPVLRSELKIKLVLIWYFSYFLLHTIIFRFGLFASGGYILFLLPLAPALSIAAVLGLHYVIEQLISYRIKLKSTVIYTIICTFCILFALINIKPYHLSKQDIAIKEAVAWINKNSLSSNTIISTNVYFYHLFPLRVPTLTLWEKFSPLETMPIGTVVVWDTIYSNMWGLEYNNFISHPEKWTLLKSFQNNSVAVFIKNQL